MNTNIPSSRTPYSQVVQSLRALPFSNGFLWVKSGWAFFKLSPGKALLSALILTLTSLFLALIPGIGFFASTLLAPCLTAGAFLTWQGFQKNGFIELEDLFAGFRTRLETLILLGFLNLAGMIAVTLLSLLAGALLGLLLFLGSDGAGLELRGLIESLIQQVAQQLSQDGESVATLFSQYPIPHLLSFVVLTGLGLAIPLVMAQAFSPALVVFEGLTAWEAMKASFWACYRNIWPFLAYSIGLTGLYLLGALTLGLGLLLVPAIQIAATYYSYTDILGKVPERLVSQGS
jgi:hypothetical protein